MSGLPKSRVYGKAGNNSSSPGNLPAGSPLTFLGWDENGNLAVLGATPDASKDNFSLAYKDSTKNFELVDRKKLTVQSNYDQSFQANKVGGKSAYYVAPLGPNGSFAGIGNITQAIFLQADLPNNTVVNIDAVCNGIKNDGTASVTARRRGLARKTGSAWSIDFQEAAVLSNAGVISACQIHLNGGNVQFEVTKATADSYYLESWAFITIVIL